MFIYGAHLVGDMVGYYLINTLKPSDACLHKRNIDSDNSLAPVWYQAIIWTNAGLLSIILLGTYFS